MAEYTFSFANSIQWPGDKDQYNIRVITQDRTLNSEFENLASTTNINGKTVNVSFSSYVSIPSQVDILFVSSTYNGALQSIIDRISGKPILIITERSQDQLYVMINFTGGSQVFEFNRVNIVNQGLTITPGFNQLGGREIDVAKLYQQIRDAVKDFEERSKAEKDRIDSLNLRSVAGMRIMQNQNQEIAEGQKALDSLVTEFANSQRRLDALTQTLNEKEQDLVILSDEILSQQSKVEEGNETLEQQKIRIQQQDAEIALREDRLDKMSTTVKEQANMLTIIVPFSIFLIIVLIFAYRAYQARRRDAKKLNQQKEELSELLEELQSTQTQLVQSEKMASLGVLTAGIAHEINNAINYVYSGIHVLDSKFTQIKPVFNTLRTIDNRDEDLRTKVEQLMTQREEVEYDDAESVMDTMIKSIRVGAERTTEIVKGLRTFSRSEDETMQEIDIHQDIDVALLLLQNRIKQNVSIDRLLTDEMPTVFGYPGQIGQALLNIISNAVDAVGDKEKGRIRIETSFIRGHVFISIKDNGVGIQPEDVDKIFDPFFTTKKIGEGTGLGLSITYGIIEKHHGIIKVNSIPGKGTEFKIKLPLNDQPLN